MRDLCVVSYWIDTLVLKNWGKYLRYFAASSSPLRGNPKQCSRGSKKSFWHRYRGGSCKSKSTIPSTHHNPYLSHYIICLSFSSPPLHPCRFIRPLFPNLLLSFSFAFFACPPACLCACLLVVMSNSLSSPLPLENEVLNFKQREGENLKDAWYRICNAQNRSTRKQSTSVLFIFFT